MNIEIDDSELKILEQALVFFYGHYTNLTTRSRSYSKKHINYKDARKKEERIAEIREKYSKKSEEVNQLIQKIILQTA